MFLPVDRHLLYVKLSAVASHRRAQRGYGFIPAIARANSKQQTKKQQRGSPPCCRPCLEAKLHLQLEEIPIAALLVMALARNGTISNGTARNGAVDYGDSRPPARVAEQRPAAVPSPLLDAGGRQLNPEDFLKAYRAKAKEFDEEGPDVLFCEKIHINNPDDFVEYCPRGVVLEQSASGSSLWDAWIRKVPNKGHGAATTEIARQMRNYAVAMSSKFNPRIQAGGGHEKVNEADLGDGDVLPEKRVDPDQALRVVVEGYYSEPRVVVEVELSNRDPLPLVKHVQMLMTRWDNLRCVIGLKIYKRSKVGGKFACVCFVWKKRSDNSIYVERVFDVGPKPSSMRSREAVAVFWNNETVDYHAISTDNGNSFKVEAMPSNLDYPLPRECPDEMEDHFTISIDKAVVYHGHTPTKWSRRKKPKRTEDLLDEAPLLIDLFLMLEAIDTVKTENFS